MDYQRLPEEQPGGFQWGPQANENNANENPNENGNANPNNEE